MSDTPRPPFVTFEVRGVEDRAASVEAGHFVAKDINYAIVTPAGTKDRIEKVAEDWLRDLQTGVEQERIPPEWLSAYRNRYEAWKNDQEVPEDGTSVKNWPAVSPAQVRTLLDLGIRTVEHLADANEEALSRIGMGGRALKQKAQAYLDSAQDRGKLAGELDKLREDNKALAERNAGLEVQLKELSTKIDALTAKK